MIGEDINFLDGEMGFVDAISAIYAKLLGA
jgi:hypothetical protein